MNNRLKTSLIAACAALTIAGGMAYAGASASASAEGSNTSKGTHQEHGRMHRHGGRDGLPMMGTLRQLDLTAEQQQSIRSLFDSNAEQRKALREQQRSNTEALANTMPDDPNYPALIAAKKQLATDAIQQASDTQTQVYALLTPEQKAKVPQVLAERKAKWEQRRAQHKERRDSTAL